MGENAGSSPARRTITKKTRSLFGIDQSQYDKLYNSQGGQCKICHTNFSAKVCIDHCHATNNIRGLLCDNCNKGIGALKDNTIIISNAIEYLQAAHDWCLLQVIDYNIIYNLAERRRKDLIKHWYGLTASQYFAILDLQCCKCAICTTELDRVLTRRDNNYKGKPCIDHCHNTKAVRGLLCNDCNIGVAQFNDDTTNLNNAIIYLNSYSGLNISTLRAERGIGKKTKICWPPIDELINKLQYMSYLQLARELGVSDNAVRKRIKTRSVKSCNYTLDNCIHLMSEAQ